MELYASVRNYNDTTFKGAFIVKNTIDLCNFDKDDGIRRRLADRARFFDTRKYYWGVQTYHERRDL